MLDYGSPNRPAVHRNSSLLDVRLQFKTQIRHLQQNEHKTNISAATSLP